MVIPIFGTLPADLTLYLAGLERSTLKVILVDNRIGPHLTRLGMRSADLLNHNRGGLAGGLNRGIELAISVGAHFITLLDQDSRLPAEHFTLLSSFLLNHNGSILVGPSIWDVDRCRQHSPKPHNENVSSTAVPGCSPTRLLITSGTTFRSVDWPRLCCFDERMEIDYIDHEWCLRARSRGFFLYQLHACVLRQHFGSPHPNPLCRLLGMQLYSPYRHFTSLRNLRLLVRLPYVPAWIKAKELLKMSVKPIAWLLFEPQRCRNLGAVIRALFVRLPIYTSDPF